MTTQSSGVKPYSLTPSTATWFPAATALTGTLTSTGIRIVGTGTSFRTQINVGDYLVDATNIARRVVDVVDDNLLRVDSAFVAPLVAATCTRVRTLVCRQLSVIFDTNNGTIKEATQDTPVTWEAGIEFKTPSSTQSYMTPICFTAGAGGGYVTETI